MVGLLSLESCCGRPKIRNSVLEGLRDRKLGGIQLGYVSNSVFNVSDDVREIQSMRMIREVEYHQHIEVVVC